MATTPVAIPVLSVFIPVYNRERYLAATVMSLLEQSFTQHELILADDGSTDGSLDLAAALARDDGRVRVLALAHQGEVGARNAAIAAAHPGARYLMNHDSDDLSLPGKLERLVDHLERHPEIGIVGCRAAYFDGSGLLPQRPEIEITPERIRRTFGRVNSMIHSAALIRREVMDALGGYREAYRSADDYDLFARALRAGFQLANLPDVLHHIRLHPHSISSERAAYVQQLAAKVGAEYEAWLRTQPDAQGLGRFLPAWLRR